MTLAEEIEILRARLETAELQRDDTGKRLSKLCDDVVEACGAPDWEYAAQVVRDVKRLRQERDDALSGQVAALHHVARLREMLSHVRVPDRGRLPGRRGRVCGRDRRPAGGAVVTEKEWASRFDGWPPTTCKRHGWQDADGGLCPSCACYLVTRLVTERDEARYELHRLRAGPWHWSPRLHKADIATVCGAGGGADVDCISRTNTFADVTCPECLRALVGQMPAEARQAWYAGTHSGGVPFVDTNDTEIGPPVYEAVARWLTDVAAALEGPS